MAKHSVKQLDFIKPIINNKFIDDNKYLREIGDGFVMELEIVSHKKGLEYVLYKFDPNQIDLFPFFTDISGLKKICDYFLFVQEGSVLYVLLIELKKGTKSAYQQLNASEVFANFIIESAARIQSEFKKQVIEIRKIRISDKRAKKTTKPKTLVYDENGIINYDLPTKFRIQPIIEL